MKKFLWRTAMVCGLVLVLAGCSDSPKAVAEKWHGAICKGDVEAANKYSTGAAQMTNAIMAGACAKGESGLISAKEVQDFKKQTFEREEISGDTAKVYVTGEKEPLKLQKVDGAWKVDISL